MPRIPLRPSKIRRCKKIVDDSDDNGDEASGNDDERNYIVTKYSSLSKSRSRSRKTFGLWTIDMDANVSRQKWELDAEPLSMAQRISAAQLGKKCLSHERMLERVSNPRVRMNIRLGKLAGFKNMPVDIIYEIATYLEPLDLLHLSRTTMWLRSLFLSRRSKFLWERVRDSMQMPACPEYLSEPAYASLVFEDHCHVCGAPNIERRTLAMEMTMCRSCRSANLAPGRKILKEMDVDSKDLGPLLKTFATLVPCLTRNLEQASTLSLDISRVNKDDTVFFKPDYAEMVGRYLLLLGYGDKARLSAFVRARQEMSKERYELDVVIENWHTERQKTKVIELEEISQQRKISILEKLKKLGYVEDEFPRPEEERLLYLQWSDVLRSPYPLKPKTWTHVLSKLKRIMEEAKAGRQHKAILARRRARYDQLRQLYATYALEAGFALDSYTTPSIDDLLLLPTFKALIEDDDDSETVNFDGWLDAKQSIPSVVREHAQGLYTAANAEVLSAMRKLVTVEMQSGGSMTSAQEVSEYLSTTTDTTATTSTDSNPSKPNLCVLACSFFTVGPSWFTHSLPFDRSIKCARDKRRGYNPWLEEHGMPLPWENMSFKCAKRMMNVAIALLKVLGFQWETTSMEEMTQMGACFACARCPTVTALMDWPSLVVHFRSETKRKEQWEKLAEGQMDKPYLGKRRAYCLDFTNEHDIKDAATRIPVHPPGTVQAGFVNELGARLDAARDRDAQAPCVFPDLNRIICEICWRMNMSYTPSDPISLKRHIRQCHGKEPEARDARSGY